MRTSSRARTLRAVLAYAATPLEEFPAVPAAIERPAFGSIAFTGPRTGKDWPRDLRNALAALVPWGELDVGQ